MVNLGNFNWELRQGTTHHGTAGPDAKYLYVSQGNGHSKTDKAILLAPEMNVLGDVCLQFNYAFYGASQGSLKIGVARFPDYFKFEQQGDDLVGYQSYGVQHFERNIQLNSVHDEIAIVAPAYAMDSRLPDAAIGSMNIKKGRC